MNVPSGTIDIKNEDGVLTLQFNCSCLDALPYCQAACCRTQQAYSSKVTEEDKKLFPILTREVMTEDGPAEVVPTKIENENECLFLDGNQKCMVHQMKPQECKNWHCSPGGVGEGITQRARGWRLEIIPKEVAHEEDVGDRDAVDNDDSYGTSTVRI